MNFLLSLTSTDYILSISYFKDLGKTTSNTDRLYCTPLTRDSRWTFLFRLSCWLSIIFLSIRTSRCLGFNLASSSIFFLLSLPSHLYHIWTKVLCCGYTSFKSSQQFSFFVARFCSVSTYKFPYMLTKILKQFISRLKVASVLALFNKCKKFVSFFGQFFIHCFSVI